MAAEPMSRYGYSKLCAELRRLKEIELPGTVKEIDAAREHGDLKENAEYHAAKDKQLFLESRIGELSRILADSQVIDPETLSHDRVSFGSTVTIVDLDSDKQFKYTIVGSFESNPSKGLISIGSPIARSLLGKMVGDEVDVSLPNNQSVYEILRVEYIPIDFD